MIVDDDPVIAHNQSQTHDIEVTSARDSPSICDPTPVAAQNSFPSSSSSASTHTDLTTKDPIGTPLCAELTRLCAKSRTDSIDDLIVSECTEVPDSSNNDSHKDGKVVSRVIRSEMRIFKSNPRYILDVEACEVSPPESIKTALASSGWKKSMEEEYTALGRNNT